MIQTKLFISHALSSSMIKPLDEQINTFIATNVVEVVDIKFSTGSVTEHRFSIVSALLIYKEID